LQQKQVFALTVDRPSATDVKRSDRDCDRSARRFDARAIRAGDADLARNAS
jgi:hypothetical protein